MKLTKKQLEKVERVLERGDKKELANYLCITPQSLSRYLSKGEMPREKLGLMLGWIDDLALTTMQSLLQSVKKP